MKPNLRLHGGLALGSLSLPLAVGCGSSPAENFNDALRAACRNTASCGEPCEPLPADPAAQIRRELQVEDPTIPDACIDLYFDIYAAFNGCVADFACATLESADEDVIVSCARGRLPADIEARITATCPD